MKKLQAFLLSCFLTISIMPGFSQVRLPQLISDGMVLQRDQKIVVWGWSSAGEKITVSFDGRQRKTTATSDGDWRVELPAMKAGGPHTMMISGRNRIEIKDILIGDVWVCAGQSNMVHQLDIHDVTYAEDIADADYPFIRHFKIPTQTNLGGPAKDVTGGQWQSATAENVRPFSAVAYFFARRLREKYHVPVGLINASVGGTPIEAWISEEGFKEFPDILTTIRQNKDTTYVNKLESRADRTGLSAQQPDKGLNGSTPWHSTDFVPRDWRTINIPGYWEDQGIKDLNGVVWYRREINIPSSMASNEATLFLGRIVDADRIYINGKEIGSTTYQYPQRRYTIPADVLKAGKNVFVLRITNHQGKGGFVPDKPYYLFTNRDTVDLKGYWQYKVGQVFTPHRSSVSTFTAQSQPTSLYNAMVAPFIQYGIKGILWYQGESNASRPEAYADLLTGLIVDWRRNFKHPDIPFIYAQLPNFMDVNYLPSESNWAILRESQLKALSMPATAMTVNIDLGEWNDIHPDNKKDVGERLALAAQKIAYGDEVVYSGPLYKAHRIEGNRIIISFSHVGSGLMTNDGENVSEFAIAGADKKFVWAQTKIHGDELIIWCEEVPEPRHVRYAWADNPDNPNLYNREGLPASPFRTDGE